MVPLTTLGVPTLGSRRASFDLKFVVVLTDGTASFSINHLVVIDITPPMETQLAVSCVIRGTHLMNAGTMPRLIDRLWSIKDENGGKSRAITAEKRRRSVDGHGEPRL